MRITEVVQVTGLSGTTIWRRVRSGDFPAPVRLGSLATRSVGWRESEIRKWIESRPYSTSRPLVTGLRRETLSSIEDMKS